MEMYSPTAIEQAPATRLASPARRTTEGSADAPTTPRIRAMFVTRPSLMPSTAARAVPLWTLTASSTCSATPSTLGALLAAAALDCGFARSMSFLRAFALRRVRAKRSCRVALIARPPRPRREPAPRRLRERGSGRGRRTRRGTPATRVAAAPRVAALEVRAEVKGHDRAAVVGHERAALADDHAVPPGSGDEVVRLDDRGNVAVVHHRQRQIVEPAAQKIALHRADPGRLAAQEVREEIDVVDRVRLGDADVGARALEAGEPPGRVADAADATALEGIAQRRRHRVEAEDVADLHEPARGRGRGFQLAPLGGRPRERLFDEAVKAGGQALARDRVMAVRRRDDVGGVDVGERLAVIGERAAWLQAVTDRPLPPRHRHVGRPEGDPELAQHAQVLPAPT